MRRVRTSWKCSEFIGHQGSRINRQKLVTRPGLGVCGIKRQNRIGSKRFALTHHAVASLAHTHTSIKCVLFYVSRTHSSFW